MDAGKFKLNRSERKRVAEAIANEIKGGNGEQNGEAGEQRKPQLRADILPTFADHDPPFRNGRLCAKANEA